MNCQAANGSIAGLIQDTTGGALGSARVTAMDEDTGVRRSGMTNGDGAYFLSGLPEGAYKITVRRTGFQTVVRWNVQVPQGHDARLDFVMQVGSMKEVVTIESGPPPMNTDDASVGTLVQRDTILKLPLNGRGVASVVELAPGVVATPASSGEAGQFSANGQRPNANYFTVDGASANTGVTGGGLPAQFAGIALPAMTAFGSSHNIVSSEALDEVRVLTSSFAPQYGRLPGAQVALTSRSGSDDFHGSAFYSMRNDTLNANDWFANANGADRGPTRLNLWGATFGGPLKRERTYFFLNYEALRLLQTNPWVVATPSQASRDQAPPQWRSVLNAYPAPGSRTLGNGLSERFAQFSRHSRLDAMSLRVDHALTDRVSVFGRYNRAPSYTESGLGQIEHFRLSSSNFTLGISSTFTPALLNDVRTNFWNTRATSDWSLDPAAGGIPADLGSILGATFTGGRAFYGVAIGGVGALYSGQSGRNRQKQWNFVDTLNWRVRGHDLRFGIDYARLSPERDGAAQSSVGIWNSLDDLLRNLQPTVMTTRAEQASALIETLSVFAQDTWRITPRWTLTYGLRWEITPPPAVRGNNNSDNSLGSSFAGPTSLPYLPVASVVNDYWRTRYGQVAPRVGVAYRINDQSVIRTAWGIFYDVGLSASLDPINGFPFNRWQFGSGFAAAVPDAPSYGSRVAPDLQLPYVKEWNVSYERMVGVRNVMTVSYVGSSGRQLLRYEGVLQPGTKLAQIIVATNHGESSYHGLETQYRRRLGRWVQGTASYAWSHSIDNGSWGSGLYLADPQITLASDRASSSFDVRHNFVAGLSFALPSSVELSTIFRARSGFPIDVQTSANLLGLTFDNIARPDLIPGVPVWINGRLNLAAFAKPAGLQGSLGRNALTGAGMSQIDLALQRSFKLTERVTLETRAEAFNALNQSNLADPVRFLDSPFFGTPVSMLNRMLGSGTARSGLTPAFQIGGPRTLQLSLRFRF